jgi:hypothetical protein
MAPHFSRRYAERTHGGLGKMPASRSKRAKIESRIVQNEATAV